MKGQSSWVSYQVTNNQSPSYMHIFIQSIRDPPYLPYSFLSFLTELKTKSKRRKGKKKGGRKNEIKKKESI